MALGIARPAVVVGRGLGLDLGMESVASIVCWGFAPGVGDKYRRKPGMLSWTDARVVAVDDRRAGMTSHHLRSIVPSYEDD
jgi:hypothetical protein